MISMNLRLLRNKIIIATLLTTVSFSAVGFGLARESPMIAKAATAEEILNDLLGNSEKKDNSTTGIHVINNLCQDSDYKISDDTYEKIKKSINPDSDNVEDFNDSPVQNLSETDSTTSYLISNHFLSRLESFTYSNGNVDFSTEPLVLDVDTGYTSKTFRKSDLYMALYKAVYGVIESRPIVWNLPSIRNVNGVESIVSNVENYDGEGNSASFNEGDYWVYVSPNVYENYLAKLLDKGLIDESELLNDDKHTFLSEYKKFHNKGKQPEWYADDTIALASETSGALGNSFTYNSNCTLKSKTFNYFVDEEIDVMEALSIIEDFMRLSEKQMTKTEANIITYKYGANALSGLANEDKDTVSFLVAKGVLNFEEEDFPNYYSVFETDTAYDLIYRFANKDARFDFSKVTITDEESFWMEKGFSQNDINVVRTTTVPSVETVEAGLSLDDIVQSNNPDEDDINLENNTNNGWQIIGKLFNMKTVNALKANTFDNYKVVKVFDNKLQYTYDNINISQLTENSSDVQKIEKTDDYTKITFVVKARSSEDAVSAVDGKISCELTTEGTTVPCFTSIEDGDGKTINMISQKSIQDLFPEISIIHDKLLTNVSTGTEALIMGESGYAIVGTKVIVSDELMIHDSGDDVYYNLDIITSLLTNAYLKELDQKIGNQITSLYVSDTNLNEARYSVYSDATLLNKTDVVQLRVGNATGAETNQRFFNMDTMSRGMNTVSRQFDIKDSQGRDAQVTVIVDLDFVVPSSTTFEDSKLSNNTLNGPLTANNIASAYFTRPSDSETDLQNWWDSNIGASNALYNFIYDTNGIVYVESGYMVPSLTILRSTDAITDEQVSEIFKDFRIYDINGVSFRKFFGNDLDQFWDFYYNTNANTGLTDVSKALAQESRKFTQITGTNSTTGTNYQGKFFVTKAGTIYRTLSQEDDYVKNTLKIDHQNKRIDLITHNATSTEASMAQIQVGDTLFYEYQDTNGNTKQTKWIYAGIENGNYVLLPQLDLLTNGWRTGTPTLQEEGGSSYTIGSLAQDSSIQNYLREFYQAGFPDIGASIDVSTYTSQTASSKLYKVDAKMFGDEVYTGEDGEALYYLSGGSVYKRTVTTEGNVSHNSLEKTTPTEDMIVTAIPVAYMPTGNITINATTEGNTITFVAHAGYKDAALHYGNVLLKNINQSVIDYTVYKDLGTKKINDLKEGDTIYIGTTLFSKVGDYFVSSPITDSVLVTAAKAAGSTSIKNQAIGIFMGQKVRVDGTERNLSDYVIDADTGPLFNEGNGEGGIVFKQNNQVKVFKDGSTKDVDSSAEKICIQVKFDDNLLARAISDTGNAYVLVYANDYLGTNSLGNLPFLNENLNYSRFDNADSDLSLSNYSVSPYAKIAKEGFLERFNSRFLHDFIGMIYTIIICICSYLIVMSWLVYGVLNYNIGRHLLEMIANPTRMQSFKGIDLIRVFTLGVYSLNSEVSAARMFTTSVINVIIIYVIMFILPH